MKFNLPQHVIWVIILVIIVVIGIFIFLIFQEGGIKNLSKILGLFHIFG